MLSALTFGDNMKIGDKVRRNPKHWKWLDQDIDPSTGKQSIGVIKEMTDDSMFDVVVKWKNGEEAFLYSFGDLALAKPAQLELFNEA